jgi:fermentation-respiration switch protein FrsA (DUF1100 family)
MIICPKTWVIFGFLVLSGCTESPKDQTPSRLMNQANEKSTAASPSKPSSQRTLDELLLFYPSKYPEGNWKPDSLTFEDCWFSANDGTRLHGWYCPCENARAVLLYAHGNAGNLSQLIQLLMYFQNDLHVTALAFDYRGYGRSEGEPSVEGVLHDARAARAYLAEHAKVQNSEIVMMGRSLGGAVVAQLAGEAKPRGLILESTFSSFHDVAEHHYPQLAWLVPESKLNSVSALARFEGPLLQSHGDSDRTIPFALGVKLFEAAKGSKDFVRIPQRDHNDPQSAEYFMVLERFIRTLQ